MFIVGWIAQGVAFLVGYAGAGSGALAAVQRSAALGRLVGRKDHPGCAGGAAEEPQLDEVVVVIE